MLEHDLKYEVFFLRDMVYIRLLMLFLTLG